MSNFGYEDLFEYPWDLCWEIICGLIELATGTMEYVVLGLINEECSRGPAARKIIYIDSDRETHSRCF